MRSPIDPQSAPPEAPHTPLAQQLMQAVSKRVDAGSGPIPMAEVRNMTFKLCHEFDEHHYYEHSQWFTRFEFEDGSHVVWGEEEV